MNKYPALIEELIERLLKLPGIGRRSAERIVGYIMSTSKDEVRLLAQAIYKVKDGVRLCSICNNLSDAEICAICRDSQRRQDIICIVERPQDVAAIEKAGGFMGTYHVLLGSISPLEGKGPMDLKIDGLAERIRKYNAKEIIIATDADTEGETTALYLAKILKPFGVAVTRIGLGIPVGSNLEYVDTATLSKSLESRRKI